MSSAGTNTAVQEGIATTYDKIQDDSIISPSSAIPDTLTPSWTPAGEKSATTEQKQGQESSNDSKADKDLVGMEVDELAADHPMSPDNKHNPASEDSICFAFGPNDTYFFGTTCGFSFTPSAVGGMESLDVTCTYTIALGESGRWFIASRTKGDAPGWQMNLRHDNKASKKKWRKSQKVVRGLEEQQALLKLSQWTDHLPRKLKDLEQTSVTFGRGATYFARRHNGCIWNDIPPGLEACIKHRQQSDSSSQPRYVALGIDKTWLAIWPGGALVYNLSTHYSSLAEVLKTAKVGDLAYVALSPYSPTDWFAQKSDGLILFSYRGKTMADHGRGIDNLARASMQARAKRDGKTFSWKRTGGTDGLAASTTIISPESNYVFPACDTMEQIQTKATETSIKASQKSVTASEIAIAAAVVTMCTVM